MFERCLIEMTSLRSTSYRKVFLNTMHGLKIRVTVLFLLLGEFVESCVFIALIVYNFAIFEAKMAIATSMSAKHLIVILWRRTHVRLSIIYRVVRALWIVSITHEMVVVVCSMLCSIHVLMVGALLRFDFG